MDKRIPYVDSIFEFKNDFHPFMSRCGLKIIDRPDDSKIIILTDIHDFDEDAGASVTNEVDNIVGKVCKQYNVNPATMILVEHYPASNWQKEPTYDLVFVDQVGDFKFKHPQWKRITEKRFLELVEGGSLKYEEIHN